MLAATDCPERELCLRAGFRCSARATLEKETPSNSFNT